MDHSGKRSLRVDQLLFPLLLNGNIAGCSVVQAVTVLLSQVKDPKLQPYGIPVFPEIPDLPYSADRDVSAEAASDGPAESAASAFPLSDCRAAFV